MALNKQSLNINFASGLDTKSDPFQVAPGKFLTLQNSVFTKTGLLQKRNGFGQLSLLPDDTTTHLLTFNNGLTAIGTKLRDYSVGSDTWIDKGQLQPISLSTLPAVRIATPISQSDSVVAPNGLMCVVFSDINNNSITLYKYSILDSATGQVLIPPTELSLGTSGVQPTTPPRVFNLGNYFVIVIAVTIAGLLHLQYVTISTSNPQIVGTATDISTQYGDVTGVPAFDGVVANDTLYVMWNGSDGGGAIRIAYLTKTLSLSSTKVFAGKRGTLFSATADNTQPAPILYFSFYQLSNTTTYTICLDASLNTIFGPTAVNTAAIANLTSASQNGITDLYYEIANNYPYGFGNIPTNFIRHNTISQAAAVTSLSIIMRSVGLASKAFAYNNITYFLTAYLSDFQPTYFLVNSSGQVLSKLAYENAGLLPNGAYLPKGLPFATVIDNSVSMSYLFIDQIQPVNKTQGSSNPAGVYGQAGVNVVTFDMQPSAASHAEIGGDLHISGGFLWMYDGVQPVEHSFFLWPDNVLATGQAAAGSMSVQQYFYVVVYEWTDGAGNIQRSAPSIPKSVTLIAGQNQVLLDIPTLRLTYKVNNPIQIAIYRWSVAQQTYYRVNPQTNLIAPTLNDKTVDYITYTDQLADASILGNAILYTTGGVVENIAAPATSDVTLFKSRLFLIDSEDQNLMWYSKQVIESTPVELSDLFTIYVAPTIGSQGNTGPLKVLAAMDDKLIMFKKNAAYYLTGNGPDNTGANNDFSEPIFITATVGCTNKNSLVMIPNGLMFQSDKGIWLLSRDMSTNYIGAPVEAFNDSTVLSAVAVPGTNQVRFTLDNGITLMYDYYFDQWGTFVNIPALSSTLYGGLHTYVNQFGQVFQETPNKYLDGANPVLLSFTTGWLNLAGLQGFERAYFVYLLATYFSPHKLTVQVAYDYNSSPSQSTIITPDNFNPIYGNDSIYGGGNPYGGQPVLEQWRVFLQQQKCQAFQLTITESFDPSMGVMPGAGFTMSGLDVLVGIKGNYPRLKASRQVG